MYIHNNININRKQIFNEVLLISYCLLFGCRFHQLIIDDFQVLSDRIWLYLQYFDSVMSNQIVVPDILTRESVFCLFINENNTKVYGHVEYLRDLVFNMHQMYNALCKRLIQVSDQYERKISSVSKIKNLHLSVILEFVKSMSFLHFSIGNQLNSNTVTLGTKTHRIARNRLQILKDRLFNCHEINQEYLKMVEAFNKEQSHFIQKCQYFKDYQKDVLKYYSLKVNIELSDKLQIKEIRLKQNQEQIFRKKQDYQSSIHQIRAGLKDYFELEKNIITEYSRLLFNIRKVNKQNSQLYPQPIMQEPSDEMNSTTNHGEPIITMRSERVVQKSILQIRREIMKEEQSIVMLQSLLQDFLAELQDGIIKAGDRIDELRSSNEYQQFNKQKKIMEDILPAESIRQIDLITSEISLFRTIILNFTTIFGKIKVFKQISKYRISNYEKFMEDTQTFVDIQKKQSIHQSQKNQFFKLEKKFSDRNLELTTRYRQRIAELQNVIIAEYYRQDKTYSPKNDKPLRNDLFEKPFYEILMHPFFLNRLDSSVYRQNIYLKKIIEHLSANQIQRSMTLSRFNKPMNNNRRKRQCCGLFQWPKADQEEPAQTLDEYHCALKDGMILIQGKLKLCQNYLGFQSQFNSKTLFGYTDIRIPKWDITQVITGKHLLSLKVTIETTHGVIDFTNFLTSDDPDQKLMELYDVKNNGLSVFHKNSNVESELAMLQERFQSEFQGELLKVGIIIDTLSTYLSEDKQKLSISIEYHPNGSSSHSLFEIKFIQKNVALQYLFIHDQHSKNNETKSALESVSKSLINRRESDLRMSHMNPAGRDRQFQFSIIEGNEKNKISFREPSFINAKLGTSILGDINLQEMRISQVDLAPLYSSSRNILSGIDTSRYDNELKGTNTENKFIAKDDSLSDAHFIQFTNETNSKIYQKKQKKQPTLKEEKKTEKKQHISQIYYQNNQSKRSKTSKGREHSNRSKSNSLQTKSFDWQNYKGIFYIIGVALVLNLVLNMFGH